MNSRGVAWWLCFAVAGWFSANAQEKEASKQAVEKRLRDVEKEKYSLSLEKAIAALAEAGSFDQVALSPDGKKVAWVQELRDPRGVETGNSTILAAPIDGKAPARRITAASRAPHAESDLAWAPDGRRIAFLSDAEKSGQLQLYLEGAAGQPAKRLTHVKGFLASPKFSPDGRTVAVLFTENAVRSAGPLVASAPETGEIKDAFFEQRLALIDIATGKLRQVSPADTYVYEFDWAPDSLHLVVTSALGNGDNNWYVAELSVLDAATGLMRSIHKPAFQIAMPAWSPDGRKIAFIEGVMSDESSVGGDIFVMPAKGGPPTNLTADRKASASWLTWTREGRIVGGEFAGADSSVISLEPATGRTESLYRGADHVSAGTWGPSVSISSDGRVSAAVRSSFENAPEVGRETTATGNRLPAGTKTRNRRGARRRAFAGGRMGSRFRAGWCIRRDLTRARSIPWSFPYTAVRARPFNPPGLRVVISAWRSRLRAISCFSQTRVGALETAKTSPAPTSAILVTGICATSLPA